MYNLNAYWHYLVEKYCDDDELENYELVSNPEFVSAMRMIAETCSRATFDISKVTRVYKLPRVEE